jgi:predicted transcriptional regulator
MARQLVRDLMTVGVETCSPETPITDLARSLLDNTGEDIIVMQDGHALGTIGIEQMIQAYAMGDYSELRAKDILHEGVAQVPPDIPLTAAVQIMLDLKVKTLFLMHNAGGITYPAAMISYRHILRHMCAQEDEELNDLGIYADRKSPVEAFLERRNAARRQNKLPEE